MTELTQPMRDWLAARVPNTLTADLPILFQARFNVTPQVSGRLMGVWAQVKWDSIKVAA